jgi:hypothetical protein
VEPRRSLGVGHGSVSHLSPARHPYEYARLADGLLKETDPVKQKQNYAQWINFITDATWVFPWSNAVPRAATSSRLQGLTYNMTEFLMPNDAWLSA